MPFILALVLAGADYVNNGLFDSATAATKQTGPEGGVAAEDGDHPAANRWSVLPRMPVPRHGLAGGVIGNRPHLVSGGIQSAGIPNMQVHSDSHDAFEIADH